MTESVTESVIDQRIRCPYCAEAMTIVVDLSAGGQSYIEDCEVCCQPMQITFEVDGDRPGPVTVDCA